MPDGQKMTPVIDISPLTSSNSELWRVVDQMIGEACQARGGFVVTGLPPLLQQKDAIVENFFKVFDLPESVLYEIAKREMRSDSKLTVRGYLNRNKGGFAYGEQFDLGREDIAPGPDIDGIEMLINKNAWPSQEPERGWRKEVIEHFQQMESLGILIIRSIARYLGVDEFAAAGRFETSSSTLRFLKYPKRPDHIEILGEKGAMRVVDGCEVPLVASEHTDNCGLTFQWQDEPGLQIQTPDGEWLGIPNIRKGFSVHLGEALDTQTSGRMHATPHRVYSTGKTRHSMVFFLEPNLFGSVKPFSTEPNEPIASDENTYAASMINTLLNTGRA
jgi:isopenicillin N synthase-like dioxygenase